MKRKLYKPPRLAKFILKQLIQFQEYSIVGDMEEVFESIQLNKNIFFAYIWYWFHTIILIHKNNISQLYWGVTMIKNYIKVAVRNIWRNKLTSFINLSGLATGIACCILISIFIINEKTYDEFHSNNDKIFCLFGEADLGFARIGDNPLPEMAERVVNEFPEIEKAVRMKREELILKKDQNSYRLHGISADSTFFEIFTFPLIYGNIENALDEKYNIILSEKKAYDLFGNQNPVGQIVSLKLEEVFIDFIVSGVTNNIPNNSSIQFDFIVNIFSIHSDQINDNQQGFPLFIFLGSENYKNQLAEKFPDTIDKEMSERFNAEGMYKIFPLNGFHLDENNMSSFLTKKGSYTFIYILSGIALLILVIGCFNYTNLSIAGLSNRLKEAGMRKILGAQKRQIGKQFLFESLLISIFALGTGLILAFFTLPFFSSLVGSPLSFALLFNKFSIMSLLFITICIAILVGFYPSLIISKITSLDLVKGKFKLTGKNIISRVLIILQFSISVFLIIGTIFLYKQNHFMLEKDLGFTKEAIIKIDLENISNQISTNRSFFNRYKEVILKQNTIIGVSGARYSLTSGWFTWVTNLKEKPGNFYICENQVDYDYLNLLGVQVLEGRNFSQDFPSDLDNGIIVNQKLVDELEIINPIGKNIGSYFIDALFDTKTIIGVVNDFHYESLTTKIQPMVIKLNDSESYNNLYVKFQGSIKETLEVLEKEYKKLVPYNPFNYSFLDEQIAFQYAKEERWSSIITFASIFAILIACSGLFGLTILIVTKRMKEIGIRKVLGAPVINIVSLINKEFLLLITIANIIAWPLVYYCTDLFLQKYPFRISIDLWNFVIGSSFTLIIAVLTISTLALRAAIRNPVDVIKYE